MNKESGFTLAEIAMVVSLVLIISAIAVPNLLKANRAYRLRSAATQIAQVFQAAKVQAIRINQKYVVTFDPTTNSIIHNSQMLVLPNGVQFETLPSEVSAPQEIQTATKSLLSLPGQQTNPKTAISFPANSLPNQLIVTFNARGLPNVEPGVLNWVYLKNSDGERIAVLLTSAGGTTVLHYKKGSWA